MRGTRSLRNIILASKSPRRKSLLARAGLKFSDIPSGFDEKTVAFSDPETYVKTLAEAKAGNVSERHPESWVIGADTIVSIDGGILEKPESEKHAQEMLRRLSGRSHRVFTGFCVCCRAEKRFLSETVFTVVKFRKLSEDRIKWYVNTSEPFDKAGGYAVQGLGRVLVKSIRGSCANAAGLPVREVMDCLRRENALDAERPGLNHLS